MAADYIPSGREDANPEIGIPSQIPSSSAEAICFRVSAVRYAEMRRAVWLVYRHREKRRAWSAQGTLVKRRARRRGNAGKTLHAVRLKAQTPFVKVRVEQESKYLINLMHNKEIRWPQRVA